ncbi:hypothetical protein LCGC14_2814140 [marine sediment metagenome]|uniref:Uncharacterized protein n=1 Tax=marine sediment metagenome TaxID=412755 RepID=A0A0F8Z5W6_9ZZZZ
MKSELDDIINRMRAATELIRRKNGQRIDLTKEKMFIKGSPFLHQATEEKSEEESAEFERSNRELFNFLRTFDNQLRDLF